MQQGKIDNKLVLMKIILRILNDERRFNKQLRLRDALINDIYFVRGKITKNSHNNAWL